MSRAVLLPAGADPFLNAYWLRHYRTWAQYVDELHIAICGSIPDDVLAYTQACVDAVGGHLYHFELRTPHGDVLAFLLSQTKADHVMLIEDDGFIRRPEAVDEAFGVLERGEHDIVACPREAYASYEVVAAARARFGREDLGLGFWPCFLFVSREHLAATDWHFAAIIWPVGATVLDVRMDREMTADTFIWASYQLRDMGLRVTLRENHRLGEDIPNYAPWFHAGSLSSGHGWMWQGNVTPERREKDLVIWRSQPVAESAKRMSWWQRAWDNWDGAIGDYHREYEKGFRGFMADIGLNQVNVDYMRRSYDPLVTWAER